MVNLASIGAPCGANVGGLNLLRIIPAFNVLSIPEAVAHIVETDVTLENGQNFLDIFFTTGGYSEGQQNTEHGEFFRQSLSVYVPKDAPDVAYFLQQLTGIRCIAIYQDGNGMAKLVGSLEAPLTFRSDLDIQDRGNGQNGHKLTFTADSLNKAYFYQMIPVVPPGQRKVFSAGFSFGFLRTQP